MSRFLLKLKDIVFCNQLVTIRWLIAVVLAFYSYYGSGLPGIDIKVVLVLAVMVISNAALYLLGGYEDRQVSILKYVFILDILCISLLVYIKGEPVDLFLLYVMVIVNSVIFYRLKNVFLVLLTVTAGFIAVYGYSGKFSLTDTSTLIRFPLFFIVAGFSGYLSKQAFIFRSEKEKAQKINSVVLDSFNSGVLGVDAGSSVIICNEYAERVLGYGRHELTGRDMAELKGLSMLASIISKSLLTGIEQVRKEIVVHDKGGERILLGCTTSLLRDSSNEILGVLVIFRDISVIYMEEKKRQHLERLALIGESTAGIAHEIKNPLQVISGFSQNLYRNYSDNPGKIREYSKKIIDEVERIDSIIKDIKNVTKTLKEDFEDIPVSPLIERVVENFKMNLKDRNIRLVIDMSIDENASIFGSKGLLEQLIVNLINNSAEAIGQKEGEIKVGAHSDAGFLYISVRDSGPGIPDDAVDRVLEPFFTTKPGGTGLGLAICNRITLLFGGDIDIKTGKEGTEVGLRFPKIKTDDK
ncbi:MAG: PAS domain-containing protein [Elusimicrobia bacterium]|nr:PAS domain-containing protein [Elusimicrobiota bacterium]